MQPNASQQTIDDITERKHLDEPIPVQYLYWAKDALTNQFGTTTIGDRPILPDLTRVMGHTLQLVIVVRAPRRPRRRLHRRLLGLTPVQRLRLHGDDVQLRRPRDAGVLARADAAGALRQHLPLVRRPDLLHREPERRRPGARAALRRSTGRSTSGFPIMVLMIASIAHVLAVHARLDARGRELRLRPHGAREGPVENSR